MQLTLVSHYGQKPQAFADLCALLQSRLTNVLGPCFSPYALPQIHSTIVGLEGARSSFGVLNANFEKCRGVNRAVNFVNLISFLREMRPFAVRVGGFTPRRDFGITSNGRHPFLRSISIQGEIAVAMGWPWAEGVCTSALVDFRKSLEQFGVLHKWHRREDDRDNDFFFVLGRIERAFVPDSQVTDAEHSLRQFLADLEPVDVLTSAATLSFVAYEDERLPLVTSRMWRVTDPQLTAQTLMSIY